MTLPTAMVFWKANGDACEDFQDGGSVLHPGFVLPPQIIFYFGDVINVVIFNQMSIGFGTHVRLLRDLGLRSLHNGLCAPWRSNPSFQPFFCNCANGPEL